MAPDIAREAKQAIALIKAFSLDLGQYSPESQVMYWLNTYRPAWIRDAIIEAVFQGRYKIISVQHILDIWQRRGQPVCHFTSGFEQVIASHLGSPIHMSTSMVTQPKDKNDVQKKQSSHYDFAPSPLSSSVITQQPKTVEASSDLGRDGHTALSIDAFPVEPVDNLVAFYKANPSPGLPKTGSANALKENNLRVDVGQDTSQVSRESQPIQPFRPMALPNGSS